MTTTQIDRRRDSDERRERFDTIVIGGGQAGLTAGYHLKRRGLPFVILDMHERVGDAWRTRWDSLRIFTPASYSGLPAGHSRTRFVVPDEGRDGRLPRGLRREVRAHRAKRRHRRPSLEDRRSLRRQAGEASTRPTTSSSRPARTTRRACPGWPRSSIRGSCNSTRATTAARRSSATATCSSSARGTPARRSHTSSRAPATPGSPDQTSGQIPSHGSRRSRARLPDRPVRHVPPRAHEGEPDRPEGPPEGRAKATPASSAPAQRPRGRGVERVSRVVGVRDGLPLLEDDRVLEPANVVWCTGFRQDFSWIDLRSSTTTACPSTSAASSRASRACTSSASCSSTRSRPTSFRTAGRDAGYITKHLKRKALRALSYAQKSATWAAASSCVHETRRSSMLTITFAARRPFASPRRRSGSRGRPCRP